MNTFHHIYHTHKDLVYNLALQYTQNREDAEEIAQDVFCSVHKKIDQFKGEASIKTWIYRITINQSLDFLKAKKSKKRWFFFSKVSLDQKDYPIDLPHFDHPGVLLEQKESIQHLFKGINQLPEHQKTALILLKIEGNQFSIMALAGTQSYAGSLDVEWQDKELQEQQFVTDFILKNIETQVSAIKVSKLETVKAGNLLHLRTLIKGHLNLNTLNFEHLVKSLHPTPAVCGLPKQNAKTFILENENYNRAFYTGFLGELNFNVVTKPRTGQRNVENRAYAVKRKSTQLYVNLRCMQLEDATINIYIGGGITETSNPEREWEETVAKSLVVKKVL